MFLVGFIEQEEGSLTRTPDDLNVFEQVVMQDAVIPGALGAVSVTGRISSFRS